MSFGVSGYRFNMNMSNGFFFLISPCKDSFDFFMSDMHGDSYDHNVDLVNGMQGEDKITSKTGATSYLIEKQIVNAFIAIYSRFSK